MSDKVIQLKDGNDNVYPKSAIKTLPFNVTVSINTANNGQYFSPAIEIPNLPNGATIISIYCAGSNFAAGITVCTLYTTEFRLASPQSVTLTNVPFRVTYYLP